MKSFHVRALLRRGARCAQEAHLDVLARALRSQDQTREQTRKDELQTTCRRRESARALKPSARVEQRKRGDRDETIPGPLLPFGRSNASVASLLRSRNGHGEAFTFLCSVILQA